MEKTEKANAYFYDMTKKVYVERCNNLGIESFKQYLEHRYRDACYNYSFYALMGLKNSDVLLRGSINFPDYKDYLHGWVEFTFDDEAYVFDNHFNSVVKKEEWYKLRNPEIYYKKTQKEILDKYLNEDYAFKVDEDFWQMKNVLYPGYKDYRQLKEAHKLNKEEWYVPATLARARVVVSKCSEEVIRFIAYDPPSC